MKEVEERQAEQISAYTHWTLSLDGWTDNSKNSIYAVLLVNRSQQHYVGNLDLAEKRHTSENILVALLQLLGENIKLVSGLVTDNPNVVKRFREDLCKQHPQIVHIGCVLHVLNLVCRDLVKSPLLESDAKNLNALVVYFANSDYWRQILMKWAQDNNITRYLTKYVETRWYSYVLMCQNAKHLENGFKYCAEKAKPFKECPAIHKDIVEIIGSNLFVGLGFQVNGWKPIADAIANLERHNASLSDVWISFYKIHEYYKTVSADTLTVKFYNIMNMLIASFNSRAAVFDTDIYITAFYLSPNYRYIATSKKYSESHVHKFIVNHARLLLGNFSDTKARELRQSLKDYQSNNSPYNGEGKDAVLYWVHENFDWAAGDFFTSDESEAE